MHKFRGLAEKGRMPGIHGFDIPVDSTLLKQCLLRHCRNSVVERRVHVCSSSVINSVRPCWGSARAFRRVSRLISKVRSVLIRERRRQVVVKNILAVLDTQLAVELQER